MGKARPMRRLALLVLLAAVLVALPRLLTTTDLPPQLGDLLGTGDRGEGDRARVVRVTDGDTLKVRLEDGSEEYVRVLGIDTPEVHTQVECGGREASAAMAALAPVGSTVRLVSDPTQADRDRYDRLLRYVERNGRDVGKALIASGHAQVYVYRDDPFRRTDAYRRAENRSEGLGQGLWSRCWR
jgi:endonuclease YncB( thermonuclease family)